MNSFSARVRTRNGSSFRDPAASTAVATSSVDGLLIGRWPPEARVNAGCAAAGRFLMTSVIAAAEERGVDAGRDRTSQDVTATRQAATTTPAITNGRSTVRHAGAGFAPVPGPAAAAGLVASRPSRWTMYCKSDPQRLTVSSN